MSTEYEAFQILTDGLQTAANGALAVARFRPDQARQWEKVAEAIKVTQAAVFQLAGEGNLHSKKGH